MAIRMGSWGLPEFGITEKIGDIFGQGRGSEGGSQLRQGTSLNIGNVPYAQAQTPKQTSTYQTGQTPTDYGYYGGEAGNVSQPQQQTSQPTQPSGGGDEGVNLSTMSGQDRNAWAISRGFTGWEDYQNNINALNRERDMAGQARRDLNTGYDQYLASLDSQLGDIGTQKGIQEKIVGSQQAEATGALEGQKTQSLADLGVESRKVEAGQTKSLQDLAEDIRNQMRAGQITLGARGAGDSSAADQYSYAISKMGTKARGNILTQTKEIQSQISDREFKVKNVYNTEINRLREQTEQKTMSIANWFSQAQRQIKDMKAQGQLGRGLNLAELSQQALQMAQNQLMTAQADARNQRDALNQWALNHSDNISQLKANLSEVGQYQSPGISAPGIQGQLSTGPTGNMAWNRTGFSGDEEERY